MTPPEPDSLPLLTDQDVVQARQHVRMLCQQAGLSLVDQTKMVTAASELARNARRYGQNGKMRWKILTAGDKTGVCLTFEDEGPGIADVGLALTDGWSTSGGLGIGLSGAKRLVQEFDLSSTIGRGTTVTVTRWG